jgi:hypothetical protein
LTEPSEIFKAIKDNEGGYISISISDGCSADLHKILDGTFIFVIKII